MSESDNEEDDKVYVFFTERAQEAEGAAGKVLYSRIARVCKVSISVFLPTCITALVWPLSAHLCESDRMCFL